jgi:hypothetical protein
LHEIPLGSPVDVWVRVEQFVPFSVFKDPQNPVLLPLRVNAKNICMPCGFLDKFERKPSFDYFKFRFISHSKFVSN